MFRLVRVMMITDSDCELMTVMSLLKDMIFKFLKDLYHTSLELLFLHYYYGKRWNPLNCTELTVSAFY